MTPEPDPDPDIVECLRMVSQQSLEPLTWWQARMFFRAFDEREKGRRAAVKMGLAMANFLKDRDDFQGRLARLFIEMFADELMPPGESQVDKLLRGESQPDC